MKPNKFSSILRPALTASAMVFTMTMAHAGTPAATAPAEPTPPANWVNFTIGGAFVSGDEASFNQRTQSSDFYGGIEDLMFTHAINDSTTLTIDGHAIPGNEDYEFNMNIEKADLGYFKAGFKQFRTWYDASGGYLEGANRNGVNDQFNDEQSIDRGEIYVETGLRMEKMPEITFSYRHLYRDGQKNSTSWGDSYPNSSWGGYTYVGKDTRPQFKFMPALWDIDERTDIFELDVNHTIGNTDLGMGLVYESYSVDNTRTTPRWGSKGTAPNQVWGVNTIKLNEQTDADMFAGHISSVTRFNDKAWLSFAASYSNMNNDTDGGSRSYRYSPITLPSTTPSRDYSYDQMSGGSNVNTFVTNLNFMWTPITNLTITPSLRYENEQMDTISKFHAFNSTSWTGLESLSANTDMNSMTEALEIRYTGLDNIVLYANGEWGQESENVKRQDNYLPGEYLSTFNDIDEQKYTIGANWYALSNLSFSIQGVYAQRDQSLGQNESNQQYATGHAGDPGGSNNFRPIMTEHDSQIYDFNARMTWRPMSNLSLVTRYDYCHTQYDNRGINWYKNTDPAVNIDPAIDYDSIQSGNVLSNIVSQSVTWSPLAALYIQGSVSWISSETDTPEQTTGDADNDYFFGSLTAGYAINDKTELTASYTYYQTDNYVNSVSYNGADTMGYGTSTEEQMIALTLTRVINPNIVWNLRYAFITSNTESKDQTGGYDDFNANMVSTGLQIRF